MLRPHAKAEDLGSCPRRSPAPMAIMKAASLEKTLNEVNAKVSMHTLCLYRVYHK